MAVLKENYQQPAKVNKDNSTVAADSQVANCFRLGYQQVIHITSTAQTLEKYLTSEGTEASHFNRP
jgi:hypothetical protein